MKSLVLYPHNITIADILEDKIVFPEKNLIGYIIEKYNDYLYKIDVNKNLLCFIHDGKYSACDFWGNNKLFHHNSDMGFWKIPPFNALFSEVSKNACSTVVSEIYNNYFRSETDYIIDTKDWVWDFLFKHPQIRTQMNLSVNEFLADKSKDYNIIFMVYDNPVNRFVRMLNNKYTSQNFILSSLMPPYDTDLKEFIDKSILLAKLNSMNIYKWDQHVVPISTYHKNILEHITDFVDIKNLDIFMEEKFNISPKHFYVSKDRIITKELLTSKQILEIEDLYKEDLQIPKKFGSKFYK